MGEITCHLQLDDVFAKLVNGDFDYIIMDIDKVPYKGKLVDYVVLKTSVLKGKSEQRRVDEGNVDTLGANAEWHYFAKDIQSYPAAYGACYVRFPTRDGKQVTKFVFVFWVGDNATARQKMCYTATKKGVCEQIGQIRTFDFQLECNGKSELEWKEIYSTVSKE